MLDPKASSSEEAVLFRLSAVFDRIIGRVRSSIASAGNPDIVVVGLPGSGRTHLMHVVAKDSKEYIVHDLDALPILAQISGLETKTKDPQQRTITKTRMSSNAYFGFFPFNEHLLIDDSYLWFDYSDLADVFPPDVYSAAFRSALYDRFGGWPAGIAAVAKRVAFGQRALLESIDDVSNDLAGRYFAKFMYGLHDGLIEDLLVCVAARGCTKKSLIDAGYESQCASIERFKIEGLVDDVGVNDRISLPRPVLVASRRMNGRLNAIGEEMADRLNRQGDTIGSATVLQNVGSTLAAIAQLQREPNLPRMVFSDETAENLCLRLDEAFIIHSPFLWLSVYAYRSRFVSSQQLLAEVENLLNVADFFVDAKLSLREILVLVRDRYLHDTKRPEFNEQKAGEMIERWSETPFASMVAFIAGEYCAVHGLYNEAQEYFSLAQVKSNNNPNVVAYGNARILRLVRCDNDMQREEGLAHLVFDLTKFATSPSAQKNAYFEVALSAWLLGDTSLFDSSMSRLELCDGAPYLSSYCEFVRAARGLSYDGQCGSTYMQAWMAFIDGLLPSRERPEAVLLKRAYDLARDSGSRFLEIVAGMTFARTLFGEQRERLLDATVLLADEIGNRTLRSRAKALLAGENLESETQFGWLKRYHASLNLESEKLSRLVLFEGVVCIDGETFPLGEKIHLLLTLLSVNPEGMSTESLMSALWPDASRESARNALKMSVRRARKALRSDTLIEKTHSGYRLDPSLRSDFHEMVEWVRAVPEAENAIAVIEAGAEFLLVLLKGLPLEIQRYEIFDDIRPVLVSLEQGVKNHLLDLLSRNYCSDRTNDLLRQMSQYDEETAEELRTAS